MKKNLAAISLTLSVSILLFGLHFILPDAKANSSETRNDINLRAEFDASPTTFERIGLSLSDASAISETRHGIASANGFTIESGRTEATLLSEPLAIPLLNADPFLAVAGSWQADGEYPDQVDLDFRFSVDGHQWSDWEHTHMAHATIEDGLHHGKLIFTDKEMRYVQFRLIIHPDEEGRTPVISSAKLNFISPGASDEHLLNEMEELAREAGPEHQVPDSFRKEKDGSEVASFPRPNFVNRSSWGNLSNTASRSVTTVTHLVVHHSAGNTTSGDFAAVVRSYWRYHTQTLGWSDIGYNWLVDRNGVVYQGRAFASNGNTNVIGAHAGGFNTNSMGICYIGNFGSTTPPATGLRAMERVLAWKADERNINPTARTRHPATGWTRNTISGHRDVGSTSCPGQRLYNLLPTVRTNVSNLINNGSPAPSKGTLTGRIYKGDDSSDLSNRIQGATVRLNTGATQTTNDVGAYTFELDPGTYTVTASKSGYQEASLSRGVTSGETTWGSMQLIPTSAPDPDPDPSPGGTITSLPWSEDFSGVAPDGDHGTQLPDGWMKIGEVQTSKWGGSSNSTTNLRFLSPTEDPIAITPEIDADISISGLKLTFKAHFATAGDSGDKIHVGYISNPSDAGSFKLVETVTLTGTFREFEVTLAGHSASDGRRIAFKAERGGSWNAHYLGKIGLEAGESTPDPNPDPDPDPDPSPDAITELPYIEDFSGVTPPNFPSGWVSFGTAEITDGWTEIGGTTIDFGRPIEDGPTAILPPIHTDIDISKLELTFNAYATTIYDIDHIKVGFVSDPSDPSSFTLVEEVELSTDVEEYTVSLKSHVAAAGRRIALQAESGGVWNRFFIGEVKVDIDESSVSAEDLADLPKQTELFQNYPNPFNPVTVISYALTEESHVRLTVYDITGREIARLTEERQSPGTYKVNWDASQLSSGVYLYRLEAGNKTLTRRMSLVK